MIATDIDPSLCSGEPAPERLEDGFSPPAPPPEDDVSAPAAAGQPERALTSKSPF